MIVFAEQYHNFQPGQLMQKKAKSNTQRRKASSAPLHKNKSMRSVERSRKERLIQIRIPALALKREFEQWDRLSDEALTEFEKLAALP
jgi:hypothetical protein